MKKLFIVLTAAVLMAGAAFAQGQSESGADIFNELMAYEPAPVPQPAPEDAEDKPAATVQSTTLMAAEDTPAATVQSTLEAAEEKPATTGQPQTALDALLDQMESADTEVKKQDLEPVEQADPVIESAEVADVDANLDERAELERDHRTAEIQGMEVVDAAWSTDLVLRSYTLASGARERMKLDDVTGTLDVEILFPQVEFPEESSAIYQPETETIFVYNTPENLAVLETMLEAMEVLKGSGDTEQVEIEAKFIEVSEGTLEELGFQWNFDNSVNLGGSLEANDGSGGLFSEALRGSPNNSSAGALPFNKKIDLGDGQVSASGDWSSFRVTDTFNTFPADITLDNRGHNPVDILISALDQSSGADVLSAPRVVTRSGQEATLRVGVLHSYPEVYEGSSSEATILGVSYQDFDEKLLGIEMAVTPEVDEGQIILALNPTITELAGWQTYQLAPANSIYNHRQKDVGVQYLTHAAITAQLPIFKIRSIETEVTIADGSTIGMGGLISEKIETFTDKVPVLGSLPLVGRLFRNEGERAVKRNLLIFVTATKVEPTGRINTSRSFE